MDLASIILPSASLTLVTARSSALGLSAGRQERTEVMASVTRWESSGSYMPNPFHAALKSSKAAVGTAVTSSHSSIESMSQLAAAIQCQCFVENRTYSLSPRLAASSFTISSPSTFPRLMRMRGLSGQLVMIAPGVTGFGL